MCYNMNILILACCFAFFFYEITNSSISDLGLMRRTFKAMPTKHIFTDTPLRTDDYYEFKGHIKPGSEPVPEINESNFFYELHEDMFQKSYWIKPPIFCFIYIWGLFYTSYFMERGATFAFGSFLNCIIFHIVVVSRDIYYLINNSVQHYAIPQELFDTNPIFIYDAVVVISSTKTQHSASYSCIVISLPSLIFEISFGAICVMFVYIVIRKKLWKLYI